MKYIHLYALCICTLLLSACSEVGNTGHSLGAILFGVFIIWVLVRLTKPDPEKKESSIHRHQLHHFENFQLSSQEFYDDLSKQIEAQQFPDLQVSVVERNTSSLLSHKRLYLKITWKDTSTFYVCAAPFGKNFFISYWLLEIPEDFSDLVMRKVFGYVPPKTMYLADMETTFKKSIETCVEHSIVSVTTKQGYRIVPDAGTAKTI